MANEVISVYFGIGVCLVQFLHTTHSKRIFGQKMVPILELIPGFSRRDPPEMKKVSLHWLDFSRLHRLPSDDNQLSLDEFSNECRQEEKEHPRLPRSLPPLQHDLEDVPRGTRFVFKILGLQATNIYYCYFMALLYGFGSYLVVHRIIPELGTVGLGQIIQLVATFSSLLIFSALFVGASAVVTTLETNIVFNTIILIIISSGMIDYQTAVTLFQFVAALTISPLVLWLNFQERWKNLTTRNLTTASFVLVPILYSELFVILLGLL